MSISSVVRLSSAVLASSLLFFALPQIAAAHAHLKTATPAQNAVVDVAPKTLELHFTEGVEAAFSGVKVSGPMAATGTVAPVLATTMAVGANDHSTVTVTLPNTLPAGRYDVQWHAVATDGHKTHGDYTFTVH